MARSKTPTNYKGKWFYVVDLAEYLEGDVRHFYLGTIWFQLDEVLADVLEFSAKSKGV